MHNALYRYISTQLAGTQEYMAMEKLYEVKDDLAYDLVLLDTPPTSHALDFLDAPERLVGAIDSAAVRWFFQAFHTSGKLSLNLLQASAAAVLRGIGKITGRGFLAQVASFITEVNELFGGWRKRADVVAAALRGPEVAYVLVTTPDTMCVREVLFFAERLRAQGMRADAYVVNRVHPPGGKLPSKAELERAIARRRLELDEGAPARILEAAREEARLAEIDRLELIALEEAFDGQADPLIAHVPDFPRDIHDVARLAWVAEHLAPLRG
jgi:anion-transporting  ArsA/GET3 family ATPase